LRRRFTIIIIGFTFIFISFTLLDAGLTSAWHQPISGIHAWQPLFFTLLPDIPMVCQQRWILPCLIRCQPQQRN